MTLSIDDSTLHFLEVSLNELRKEDVFKVKAVSCPHCHGPIKFPVVAREQDVKEFQFLLNSLHAVARRHGLDLLLLSELEVEIQLELARRRSKDDRA